MFFTEYHRILIVPAMARNIAIRELHTTPHLAHFIGNNDDDTVTIDVVIIIINCNSNNNNLKVMPWLQS